MRKARAKERWKNNTRLSKKAAKWNYFDWNEIKRKWMWKQNDAHRNEQNTNKSNKRKWKNKLKNHHFAIVYYSL